MSGMDSKRLSARAKQPGDDWTYRESEANFIAVARHCLDAERYRIDEKPKELLNLFPPTAKGQRALGVRPEAMIVSLTTGRRLFVEVKKQGDRGNADERACKHHTVQFYRTLKERYGYNYHPFVTVLCEALATNPRYTRKSPYYFEPLQYFNWVDYDYDSLCTYLNERCADWLD